MSSLFGFAASYVVNALWQVALIAAVAWLAAKLVKRLGPQAEHLVWVAALAVSVITPAVPAFRRLLEAATVSRMSGGGAVMLFSSGAGGPAGRGGVLALSAFWMGCVVAGYAAALVYFAGRLVVKFTAAVRLLSSAREASLTPELDEIWRSCARAFELKGARVLACAEVRGPVALGFREPILILPVNFSSTCTAQDFLSAVAHECAHLKRRDFQKNLLYEVASLLLAFHPLLWVVQSGIAETREMICDGMVTKEHVEAATYARSLLRLAAAMAVDWRGSGSYAVGIFDGNILEKRIMRIRVKKQSVGAAMRYGLMISAAAVLVSTVLGAAAVAKPVMTQAGTQDKTQSSRNGHVYKVGHGVSAPVPLKTVDAEFPKSARKGSKLEGVVVLGLVVDDAGMPEHVHVVKSLRPDFDGEAVKAVERYRFRPAMRSGKPVAVSVNIEVHFKRY